MDPITVGVVLAVAVGKGIRNRHVRTRRNERLNKANQIIMQLVNERCDLDHFRLLCKKYNSIFDSVDEAEIQNLSQNPTIQQNAKYLMGLYGRSETTKQFVKQAAEIGTLELLRRQNEIEASREKMLLLIEAGYDLAALQIIAEEAKANGWDEEAILEAANTLWSDSTAKEALSEQAMGLIASYMENELVVEILSEVCALLLENATEAVNGVLEELAYEITTWIFSS